VGATSCLVGEFRGRRIEAIYEITEYDPNRMTAWKTVSGPLPMYSSRCRRRAASGSKVRSAHQTRSLILNSSNDLDVPILGIS